MKPNQISGAKRPFFELFQIIVVLSFQPTGSNRERKTDQGESNDFEKASLSFQVFLIR